MRKSVLFTSLFPVLPTNLFHVSKINALNASDDKLDGMVHKVWSSFVKREESDSGGKGVPKFYAPRNVGMAAFAFSVSLSLSLSQRHMRVRTTMSSVKKTSLAAKWFHYPLSTFGADGDKLFLFTASA